VCLAVVTLGAGNDFPFGTEANTKRECAELAKFRGEWRIPFSGFGLLHKVMGIVMAEWLREGVPVRWIAAL
jgi:hypothetical protein